MDKKFWKGKKVLITGHTGFKGSWLSIWLNELGAKVFGYGLDPYTEQDNFFLSGISNKIIDIRGDIRDLSYLTEIFQTYQPEIVFHLAAQPLVRLSYAQPILTYESNVIGTLHVLEAIRHTESVKSTVIVTTDKCYENKETTYGYKETDPFGGYDPYSSSKACAEILTASYRKSYFNPNEHKKHGKSIASVRAGNVIGGGDWAQDRIVPDCIRSLETDGIIEIRSPHAIRPWQHVLEPLAGYILLAEKMSVDPVQYAQGWNFGPESTTFSNVWNLADLIVRDYGKGELKDISNPNDLHEANLLYLDINKAKNILNWYPKLSLEETVHFTVEWYKNYKNQDVYSLCKQQIKKYEQKGKD